MAIGFRKLALVGAAIVVGGLAVAGDAFAQGYPTTQQYGQPGMRPGGPGVRPGGPVTRPNPGYPGRPPGQWQRPRPPQGNWGPGRPHYAPPMMRPRPPRCTIQYRMVPSPYGMVRRPVRVCY